jgi:Fic family protein
MAKNNNNILTRNYSGQVAKEIVFKNYKDDTLMTKYPDRSNVRLSLLQRESNGIFKKAVAHAKAVMADPERTATIKKELKSRKKTARQSVYHACIQQYMRENSRSALFAEAEELVERYLAAFDLSERQALGLKYLAFQQELNNPTYQDINKVSKATATRDLQDMVRRGIISVSGWGAGIKYDLLPISRDDPK